MNWLNDLKEAVKKNHSFYKKIEISKIGYILVSKLHYTYPEIIVVKTNDNNIKENIIFHESNLSAFDCWDLAREWKANLENNY